MNDEWQTPDWLFKQLDDEFHFEVDLCASRENRKCKMYCDDVELIVGYKYVFDDNINCNYWEQIWLEGFACFMNPPYSRNKIYTCVKTARKLSRRNKCTVVCILPASTDTKWWGIFWDYEKHRPKPGVEVRFLPKRVAFVNPETGLETKGNTKGTAIVIIRPLK